MLSEVECAIKELKKGKTTGTDNIKAEQIQEGGDATANVIHKLCNAILRTKVWPKSMDRECAHNNTKEGKQQEVLRLPNDQLDQSIAEDNSETNNT